MLKSLAWTVRPRVITKSFCQPNWHWDSLSQNWTGPLVWFVLEGRGHLRTPRGTFELRGGDCFVLDSADRHIGSHNPTRPLIVSWSHFDFCTPRGRVIPDPLELAYYRRIETTAFPATLFDRAIDPWNTPGGAKDQAVHWLTAFLLELARIDRRPARSGPVREHGDAIEAICQSIRETPAAPVRIADLARQAHCSPDHFTRIFKTVKGMTPKAFVIQARIDAAKDLLRFSTHPVGRIAELLGYRDVYFFSRQFKEWTGRSASDYRRGA